ncbi:MAG: GNAT family N-acetyltransferase [Bacteroidales bacterium]|nr:GNAT family N-acetyltransferase [Bacteroidales bacterium]
MEQSTTIVLRALEPEDIDCLYKWENDNSIWQVSNTIVPFSRYLLTKYIESAHLDIYQTRQLRLMADFFKDGLKVKTVGAVDIFDFEPFHQRAGIGILIGEKEERGKGYASAALAEIIHYAFNVLLLKQLYCNVETTNTTSINLFKKHGFIEVGVKKMWLRTSEGYKDEALLQLLNENI